MAEERRIIMLIDDDETCLAFGREILESRYTVYPVSSGEQAFTILKKITPDLILLDIEMPGMNGYAVLNRIRQTPETENIPVIFLTSFNDPGNELDALSKGAIDYITKPFSPLLLVQRIENHLMFNIQKKELSLCIDSLKKTSDEQMAEIRKIQNVIVSIVPEIIAVRDATGSGQMPHGHIEKIPQYLTVMIGAMQRQGLYKNEIESLDTETFCNASRMHDVGNIYISESILNKPGKLNAAEFEEIKKHPENGLKIISRIRQLAGEYSFLEYAGIFAVSHHERWDGSGYPAGRRGPDIPLAGRLMALADVYDALVSKRPYKQPVDPHEASKEIMKGAGLAFDPALVEIFRIVTGEFIQIALK